MSPLVTAPALLAASPCVVVLTTEQFAEALTCAADAGAKRALEMMQPTTLTKSQLAAALNRSVATIDRYIAAGMPYGGGARKTFDPRDCNAWLAARPNERKNILTQGVVKKSRAA